MRTGQLGPFRAFALILCIFLLQGSGGIAHATPDGGEKSPAARSAAPKSDPKPEVIAVLGDSLGDGLWAGLYRLLRREKKFTVVQKSKVSSGLTTTTFFNWIDAAKTIKKDEKIRIAVVFLGANDQQALKHEKNWHRFRSETWKKIYTGRIKKLIRELKKKKLEVYWVGLPVMQKEGFDAGAQFLNGLYRRTAAEQKISYIDIRKVTAGENGKYATHYKDLKGKTRLMRADDGVHFTMSGYIVIASHVFVQIQAERKKAKEKKNKRKTTIAGAAPAGDESTGQAALPAGHPAPPR